MRGSTMKRTVVAAMVALVMVQARAEPQPDGLVKVGISQHAAGTYYVAAAIEGLGPVELLVDTGSSYLAINQVMLDALRRAGGAEFSRNLEGHLADGGVHVIPLYRLAGVRLGEGCWIHDVEAAVFPGSTRPILGMNVLARVAPFTLSAQPAQLSLANCRGAPPTRAQEAAADAPAAPVEGAAQ